MTRRLVTGVVAGAIATVFAGTVAAQTTGYVPGVAGANPTNSGYVLSGSGTPDNNVVRSGVYNSTAGLSGRAASA